MSGLKTLCFAMLCACAVTAVAADPVPQTRQEWLRAAWTTMAQFRNTVPTIVDLSGKHEVLVSITVGRDGTITATRLKKSSGSEALDRNAVQMIHRSSPLPPLPADMDETDFVTLPVVYDFGQQTVQQSGKSRRRALADQFSR